MKGEVRYMYLGFDLDIASTNKFWEALVVESRKFCKGK